MLKINVQVAHMRHPLPGCRLAGASLWSAFPTPHAHGQQPRGAPQAGLVLAPQVVLVWHWQCWAGRLTPPCTAGTSQISIYTCFYHT